MHSNAIHVLSKIAMVALKNSKKFKEEIWKNKHMTRTATAIFVDAPRALVVWTSAPAGSAAKQESSMKNQIIENSKTQTAR